MSRIPRFFADTTFWIALTRVRDQYHGDALAWHDHLLVSRALIVATEAVCWEWLNAMSGAPTRRVAAEGLMQIRRDPLIDVIRLTDELSEAALQLFSARPDKDWSLTDCLSFVVMERWNIQDALTADTHFEEAGFRAVLLSTPPGG